MSGGSGVPFLTSGEGRAALSPPMLGAEPSLAGTAGDPVLAGTDRGGIANDGGGGVPWTVYWALNARKSGVPIGVEPVELSGRVGRPRILSGLVGVDIVVDYLLTSGR